MSIPGLASPCWDRGTGGFSFSIWIARFTSLTFPALRERRLFVIPEETRTPKVVADLVEWERRLSVSIPDVGEGGDALRYAVSDPGFYVRHRQHTRIRPRASASILPKIAAGSELSEKELFTALSERRCFDALHARYAGAVLSNAGGEGLRSPTH